MLNHFDFIKPSSGLYNGEKLLLQATIFNVDFTIIINSSHLEYFVYIYIYIYIYI